MSWSDTAQVYKQRKSRESPLWQLLSAHFDEFEERYDELFSKEYGFYRPIISHVVGKFWNVVTYIRGSLEFAARITTMNISWRFHAVADGFVPHVTPKKLYSSPRISRTKCYTLFPTGSMFSASPRLSAAISFSIVNCSASWPNARLQVSQPSFRQY